MLEVQLTLHVIMWPLSWAFSWGVGVSGRTSKLGYVVGGLQNHRAGPLSSINVPITHLYSCYKAGWFELWPQSEGSSRLSRTTTLNPWHTHTHFQIYVKSCIYRSLTSSRNTDRPVNRELRLCAQLPFYNSRVHVTADAALIRPLLTSCSMMEN